ncbi:MAG: TolC family protein [Candidatus Aminicenantes bacterium]|nr:TolC family protein [Candidatus Aminicenantes bacterium]
MWKKNLSINKFWVLFLLVFLSAQLSAAANGLDMEKHDQVIRLTLKGAQDYAVKHALETRNAKLDIKEAKKKIWETTAFGLPQITTTVGYQNMLKLPTTLIPAIIFDPDAPEDEFLELQFGVQHNATVDIAVNQLLFSGPYIVGLRAAKIFLQLSKDQLKKSEIQVKETVTRTYYLVLLALETKITIEENLKNLQRLLYETRELYQEGFLEENDLDQIQLSVSNLNNALRSINRQIRISQRLLKFQMGMSLETEIQISENLGAITSEINAQELLQLDLSIHNHIDYKIITTQEKSLALVLKKEITEYFPSIAAFFNYTLTAMRDEFNFFRNTDESWFPSMIAGINITIPIFDSGIKAAKIQQAKYQLQKIRNSKKQVEEGLQLQYTQAKSEFADALENSKTNVANVQLARKIYNKATIKYKEGLIASLELIQLHNQYLNAEATYIRTMVDLLNAKTKLDVVLNRL